MAYINTVNRKKPYRIKYETITVTLAEDPRKGICCACGQDIRDGKIKNTQMHHYFYEFKPATVKESPELALRNTGEFDFYCHEIANGLMNILTANPDRVVQVMKTLPIKQRQRLLEIMTELIEYWNKDAQGKDEQLNNIKVNLEQMFSS